MMSYGKKIMCGMGLSLLTIFSAPALAVVVEWTDWQSSPNSYSALGEIVMNGSTIDVDYVGTGAHRFVQTGSGIDYWSGTAYTNGSVDNAPTARELIALNGGGTVTINFSETVYNPFLAINSWNGNTVEFGEAISIDSFGQGYWGSGTPVLNATGTGFYGSGEVHGVISLQGAYDSISFTHTGENWHGFTVGVSPVPEPATIGLFMLGSGFVFWAGMRRKKQEITEEFAA